MRELLQKYLDGEATLDDVTSYIVLNCWFANEERGLIETVTIYLAWLDDGYIGPDELCQQFHELILEA